MQPLLKICLKVRVWFVCQAQSTESMCTHPLVTQEKYKTLHEFIVYRHLLISAALVSLCLCLWASDIKTSDCIQNFQTLHFWWLDDVWWRSEYKRLSPKCILFHCIQITKCECPCVLHHIIGLKSKSHKSSPPLWNAAPSTHSHPPSVASRRFRLTSPNRLPSTRAAPGSSACMRYITKSPSSPVHVNETQAPLQASKALLSTDCYHFISGLWAGYVQTGL